MDTRVTTLNNAELSDFLDAARASVNTPVQYDADGYNSDGYNKDGYDANGYNRAGFDQLGYTKDGFNSDGYNVWGYNAEGFTRDGYDRAGYNRDGINSTGYNRAGFNREGYNWCGYDRYGYNKSGYNRDGYNSDGYDSDGLNRDGYDVNGYDCVGYNWYGCDRDGYRKGSTRSVGELPQGKPFAEYIIGFEDAGYDSDGYNQGGYNRDGYDKDGYDSEGYDLNGYNEDGYDREGYDEEGYDKNGYDGNDYDREGYDLNGYDSDGYDSDGYDYDGYNYEGYDSEGYDSDGYNEDGYDTDGRSRSGLERDDTSPSDDDYYDKVSSYKDKERCGCVGNDDGITLGYEIELVHNSFCDGYATNDAAIEAIQVSGNRRRILAEKDSSLDDGGIEFVTGYCTWEAHKEKLQAFCEAVDKNGFGRDESAGVHIHVGNHGQHDTTFEALYWLLADHRNRILVEDVAGRYNTRFCKAENTYTQGAEVSQHDRYAIVNRRYATWEFRCFDSTTKFETLTRYTEFCLATLAYATEITQDGKPVVATDEFKTSPLHYTAFLTWLRQHTLVYPTLIEYTKDVI